MSIFICRINNKIKYFSNLDNATNYLNDIMEILIDHNIQNIYNNNNYSISIFNDIDNSNLIKIITLKDNVLKNQNKDNILNDKNKILTDKNKILTDRNNGLKENKKSIKEEYENKISNIKTHTKIENIENYDIVDNPKLRKFKADKQVYNRLKEENINENNIPFLFLNEYPIFKILEEINYSSIQEECDEFHRIYDEMYPEIKEEKIFIPHNIAYLKPYVKDNIAKLNNMTFEEINNYVDETEQKLKEIVNKNNF